MPNSVGLPLKCARSLSGNRLFTWKVILVKILMNFQVLLNVIWQPELFLKKKKKRDPPLLCAQPLPHMLHCF